MHSEGIGHGASFTVRLGRLTESAAMPSASAEATAGSASPALRLLVADDNVDLAESFAELLCALGHEVEVVNDGAAAVAAARINLPDIALLDIGMPHLNGYQVAQALRADPATRGIRLVAITGWGQEADRLQAKAAGFDLHLVKPVAPEKLASVLASLGAGTASS